MQGLDKLRSATTSHLAELYFKGSRSAANKRLRKLLDLDLVHVTIRRLDAENVYAVSPKGRRELSNDGQESPRRIRRPTQLEHVLLINTVRVTLATGLEDIGGELAGWQSDWELRNFGRSLVPDAVFSIRWDEAPAVEYTLEVDNETRSPQAFLQKILRYARADYSGLSRKHAKEVTLVVARHEHWADRYRGIAGQLSSNRILAFTTVEKLLTGLSHEVWTLTGNPDSYSLRALETLRYRKDTPAAQRDFVSGDYDHEHTRISYDHD